MSTFSISRRRFIKKLKVLALTGSVPFLFDLQRIAAATGGDDYKALVCVFLFGGNDSHNMIIPHDVAQYNYYAGRRRAFAIPREQLLYLTQQGQATQNFGMHPSFVELRTLFDQQKVAVIGNVGPLLYPITRAQFFAGTVPTPPYLFSHSDQVEHWQTSLPDRAALTGWAGRTADLLSATYGGGALSMLVSLAGTNTLQTAAQIAPYQMTTSGTISLGGYAEASTDPLARALRQIIIQPRWNLLEDEYSNILARAVDTDNAVRTALSGAPAFTFPATGLGQQLKMIAKLIAVRQALGVRRQIFFCGIGGFDTHADQLYDQPRLLTQVSQAMGAFYQATVQMGIPEKVTAFTASDFGRTLLPNGQGTDHGWGSHHVVMGGSVIGGRIYGLFPDLTLDGPDDGGEGRLIPTTAVDQYAAKLASWFGVSSGNMATVFPNLSRFNGTATSNLLNFLS